MPDREKVIKGLELIIWEVEKNLMWLPGDDDIRDAIALLKEQEAVEPEVDVLNEIDRLYRCPKCHKYFFHRKQRYCDQCGQAVKWDE